jgi:hypothetical protein
MNWCQAIVDDIKVNTQDLNDSIANNDKSTPNGQGCIAFFVVSFCQLFLVFLCLPFIIFVVAFFVSAFYYYLQF